MNCCLETVKMGVFACHRESAGSGEAARGTIGLVRPTLTSGDGMAGHMHSLMRYLFLYSHVRPKHPQVSPAINSKITSYPFAGKNQCHGAEYPFGESTVNLHICIVLLDHGYYPNRW